MDEVTVRRERRGDGVCKSGSYNIPDESVTLTSDKTNNNYIKKLKFCLKL